MDGTSGPNLNLELFERETFNVEDYVKKIVAESIYASNISDTKDKLNRSAHQTSEEIKQSVYKNYANFMETSKEVGHLEGKMSQLRQSLDEQRKLLSLFKNLNINTINMNDAKKSSGGEGGMQKSSLAILLEQVEGCGLITQKPGRNLLFHSDLEALHLDDYTISHKLHAYLLSDALLLTLPQRKRTKTNFNTSAIMSNNAVNRLINNPLLATAGSKNSDSSSNSYQYKFHAFYELQDIKIMNIDDSKEVRNAFQLLKFPESLAFRCANAHLKKEWLENCENAKKQLSLQIDQLGDNRMVSSTSNQDKSYNTIEEEDEAEEEELDTTEAKLKLNLNNMSEHERNKILRELFSDFDILLAQRDFEKAVEMLLKIKQSTNSSKSAVMSKSQDGQSNIYDYQQLIYKQKETELINILRKDLVLSKERGNNKGVIKTGKRVVNSLIKLGIYDEAIDLFIDYHKHLNAETLRKIKLEESNTIYMNKVLSLFFENLRISFQSFGEAFSNLINYCFSSYSSWYDTEIEILIKKLQSQHYLGRHFDLTIDNCELIFIKSKQFSSMNNFELTFLFESKLSPILEKTIREQHDILIDASIQRSKIELDDSLKLTAQAKANYEQNRQVQIEKLITDLTQKHKLEDYFNEEDFINMRSCTSSALQFSCGVINFLCDCLRVYYQDISFCLVETITKLFKLELKLYSNYLLKNANRDKENSNKNNRVKKEDIFHNVCCIEKIFLVCEKLYFNKTSVHSKFFVKLAEKFLAFKAENFGVKN